MRSSGADVRELLHDGHPPACVGIAAFACVNVFRAHVEALRQLIPGCISRSGAPPLMADVKARSEG